MLATRRALLGAPLVLAAPVLPAPAVRAQGAFPDRPITMIVAFAAGGGTDTAARTIARFMERDLGQPVVVVNRPGAGGEIGFAELARARPDGHVIGFINTPHIVTLPIERRTAFRLESFSLIANVVDDPGGFFVRGDNRFRTLADVVAAARAAPGAISYGTTGIGSDDHLAGLALERAAGISLLHVPFAGSAQVKTAVLARNIEIASMNVAEAVGESRDGTLRGLGQMGRERWPVLGDLPTFREQGYDIVEGSMRGMAAPAGVPAAVMARLATALQRTVEDPEFGAMAARQNLPLRFLGPEAYAAELRAMQVTYQGVWERAPWKE